MLIETAPRSPRRRLSLSYGTSTLGQVSEPRHGVCLSVPSQVYRIGHGAGVGSGGPGIVSWVLCEHCTGHRMNTSARRVVIASGVEGGGGLGGCNSTRSISSQYGSFMQTQL